MHDLEPVHLLPEVKYQCKAIL